LLCPCEAKLRSGRLPRRLASQIGGGLFRSRTVDKKVFLIKEPAAEAMPAPRLHAPLEIKPSQPLICVIFCGGFVSVHLKFSALNEEVVRKVLQRVSAETDLDKEIK